MRAVRVRAYYTRYPHWGAYAGFQQVVRHIDPAAASVLLRPVSDSDEDWPVPEGALNARLRRAGVSRGMAWYKLSDLAAEIRALPVSVANRIDLIHFLDAEHTGQYLQGWIRRSRWSRVKTVATFHQPPELLEGLTNPDAIRQLDLALVVSPTQVPFFRQFLPPDRVRTFLHGVDTRFFRPGAARDAGAVFKCITVGHWMRDWEAVRAVAASLSGRSDIEFHVVTNRQTGLEDLPNVHRHQNVDDEGLRRLYQDAHVLFLPLINATANNSLMEGLACGLPVVSSRLESVMAYIDERSACLIADNDPASLTEAILHLQRNPDRRLALARASRARAETLAWPHVARELAAIYRALVTPALR